jgi:hypothetical protein
LLSDNACDSTAAGASTAAPSARLGTKKNFFLDCRLACKTEQ